MSYPCNFGEKTEIEIPKYALNDVYIGETSPTRLSYLELQIDDVPAEKQKSSGFLILTGSGSTAWGYHVNALDYYRTEQFLNILRESGLADKKLCSSEIIDIMNKFNDSFIFGPEDRRMKFITREALQNSVFRAVNTQGFAKSITVRSLCWNGKIVMDGIQRKFNFDDGVIANFTTSGCDSINSIQYVD
jgi:NAD+ kinase